MDRLTKISMHRVDETHDVDEWQDTLYTYDHRGLVKTEVNAKGDGKAYVYDGNGNLISLTDEDGYVTEYTYNEVNLVSGINYNGAKTVSYLYNGTGELVEMTDWNGTTSIERDLLNRITKVTDHEGREVQYGWDNVGNKTVQGYPDGTQADYYYDAENQITEVVDPDGGVTKYEYDANGNKTFKEYPNYETAYYFYDECDRVIEMDEYNLNGKKLYKTTYSWDAEGNLLSEMQYNHGQSGSSNGNGNQKSASVADPGSSLASVLELSTLATVGETLQEGISSILENVEEIAGGSEADLPKLQIPDTFVEAVEEKTGVDLNLDAVDPEAEAPAAEVETPEAAAPAAKEAEVPETPETDTPDVEVEAPEAEAPSVETEPETTDDPEDAEDEDGNNPEGFEWGNGNGEVPPGQNVDEDGNIVNDGGHMPPGLNRGEKPDKGDNPNPPEVPDTPGTEDKSDRKANKGTHIYTYDELNRMVTSNIAKELTTYTYDTLGNLVGESVKNKSVDYQYNELNQLVYRKDSQNQEYTYTYDKRGNRVAETGKKESRAFVYDETNRLVEGTNWKGDKSSYTYNGLGVRINNTQTSHSGSVYSRDYVIDYTSLERDDLMVYAEGGGQLDYVQREVYAGSERIEQFTDRTGSGYERLLYVHEDLQGNTRYYTKDNGQSFAELTYDAWGMPESPNKLLNNDHGNYVYATYTGHIFDTTLDIYFAEARFYDAQTRQWLAMDPIKDGGNWYQYCYSNPLRYWDPTGLWTKIDADYNFSQFTGCGNEKNDVYMLLNLDGAAKFGHAALLLVNESGEGLFYSFMGSDNALKIYLGFNSNSALGSAYGTPEEVNDLLKTGDIAFSYEYKSSFGNTFVSVDDNYDRALSKEITNEELETMLDEIEVYGSESYNLYTNNCGDFVMNVTGTIDEQINSSRNHALPNVQYVYWEMRASDSWDDIYIGKDTGIEKGLEVLYTSIGFMPVRNVVYPVIN